MPCLSKDCERYAAQPYGGRKEASLDQREGQSVFCTCKPKVIALEAGGRVAAEARVAICVRLAACWWLAVELDWGLIGIWAGTTLDWATRAIWLGVVWHRGRWVERGVGADQQVR